MNGHISKLQVIGMLFASAVTLGACGGGDNPPASVSDVVIVKKGIVRGSNAAVKEVEAIAFQAIKVLDVRCALVFPPPNPPGAATSQLPEFVLLLDVSAADVEKTRAFGFSIFNPDEQARKSGAVCT